MVKAVSNFIFLFAKVKRLERYASIEKGRIVIIMLAGSGATSHVMRTLSKQYTGRT